MCDTFSFFSKVEPHQSFFAKNSDRDPGEPQVIEIIDDAKDDFKTNFLPVHLKKYLKVQYEKLKEVFPEFDHPYSAVISRPLWIWGAEMGINEKGVAIGNEAVFSKQPLIKDGLLGMDILRLALHNAATADEAAEFFIRLLEKYGQGGNGSYSGTLNYHNSFLIKDPVKAVIIESSGRSWARKDINNYASISNSYLLTDDYDEAGGDIKGKNLKKKFEKKYLDFFSKGDYRQALTSGKIKTCDKDLNDVFGILRWHQDGSEKPKRGMKSICIHPGLIVKTETTASMVVDYIDDKQIIWLTSSPNPCVSLFKPLVLDKDQNTFVQFRSLDLSTEYFKENRKISEYLLKNQDLFHSKIKEERDKLEAEFQAIIYKDIKNKSKEQLIRDCRLCYDKEKEYHKMIRGFIEIL